MCDKTKIKTMMTTFTVHQLDTLLNKYDEYLGLLFFFDPNNSANTQRFTNFVESWKKQLLSLFQSLKKEIRSKGVAEETTKNDIIELYKDFMMWDCIWNRFAVGAKGMRKVDYKKPDLPKFWEIEINIEKDFNEISDKALIQELGLQDYATIGERLKFLSEHFHHDALYQNVGRVQKRKKRAEGYREFMDGNNGIRSILQEFDDFFFKTFDDKFYPHVEMNNNQVGKGVKAEYYGNASLTFLQFKTLDHKIDGDVRKDFKFKDIVEYGISLSTFMYKQFEKYPDHFFPTRNKKRRRVIHEDDEDNNDREEEEPPQQVVVVARRRKMGKCNEETPPTIMNPRVAAALDLSNTQAILKQAVSTVDKGISVI